VPVKPTQFAVILSGFTGFLRLQIVLKSHIHRNIQQLLKLQILQKIQYKSKIYKNHRVKINIYKFKHRKISDFKIHLQCKTANTIIFVQFKSFYIQYCSISHSDHNKSIKKISEETRNV